MQTHFSRTFQQQQMGVALLVALIFLVVLTLLGISVYWTSTADERMARNFRDKEIALLGAEAAMNEAIMLITGSYDSASTPSPKPTAMSSDRCFTNPPTGFSCDSSLSPTSLDLFSGAVTGAPLGQIGTNLSPTISGYDGGVQPRYLVILQKPDACGPSENAKNESTCFLIVSQSRGRLPNTQVNLLTLFRN
ncbi:MAG: PilX N-terminal domain-containing pilus assembly protein [Dechloromonas sp.]|uniref:pilus assembly PilX family protein n=1 Tax=Azonexus sp. TaxID=1872668 RepID=UPI0035AE384D|nr:PilX N-terminal domain-containing pilus assembly protein [Dechloromonas sp.]